MGRRKNNILPEPGCCKICGNKLNHHKRIFCSSECWGISLKTPLKEYRCDGCGEFFKSKTHKKLKHIFCSNKCFREWNKGSNNPSYYKGAKIKSICQTCGKGIEFWKSSYPNGKKYCSRKCCSENSEWKEKSRKSKTKTFDGVSDKIIKKRLRSCQKYKDWCRKIYERDGFKCTKCGSKKNMQTHHIIPFSVIYEECKLMGIKDFSPIFDVDNGETICEDCHKKTDSYMVGTKIIEFRLIKALRNKWKNSDLKNKVEFETYYANEMERLINEYKEKIESEG